MKYLTILALVCVSFQLALAAPADKVDCSKLDEVLDDLGSAQAITTLNDKYKLMTNTEEAVKRCAEVTEAIKTLRKYNKECLSSLTQQVLSAVLRTRSQMMDARCKDQNSAEFKEAVESSKCIAENAFEPAKEAESKSILAFQVLLDANLPDEKARLRRSCCGVLDSKKFFLDATRPKCGKYEKIYTEYVDSYMSEAMSLICPTEDKLECGKLEALKTEGVAAKTKFFLAPMVNMVKTLDH